MNVWQWITVVAGLYLLVGIGVTVWQARRVSWGDAAVIGAAWLPVLLITWIVSAISWTPDSRE